MGGNTCCAARFNRGAAPVNRDTDRFTRLGFHLEDGGDFVFERQETFAWILAFDIGIAMFNRELRPLPIPCEHFGEGFY